MIGRALVVLTVDGQELQLRFTYYRPPRKWYVEFLDVEFLGIYILHSITTQAPLMHSNLQ